MRALSHSARRHALARWSVSGVIRAHDSDNHSCRHITGGNILSALLLDRLSTYAPWPGAFPVMHKAGGLLCSSTDRARNVSAHVWVRLPPEERIPPEHRVVAELQPVRYPERLRAIGGAVDYRESDSKGFAVQHLMHAGQLPEVIPRKHALCRSHGAMTVSKTVRLGPTPSRRATVLAYQG